MSLSEEQYVLLDGGLVLVVDELAQNVMAELPVMGSLRTQLMTEVEPVRSPDGSIVEVSSTQPLWSGDGPTPRLFEQVDVQSYELAQNVATEEEDGLTIWGVARSLAVAASDWASVRRDSSSRPVTALSLQRVELVPSIKPLQQTTTVASQSIRWVKGVTVRSSASQRVAL